MNSKKILTDVLEHSLPDEVLNGLKVSMCSFLVMRSRLFSVIKRKDGTFAVELTPKS